MADGKLPSDAVRVSQTELEAAIVGMAVAEGLGLSGDHEWLI